jgi:hypothetical protein
VIPHEVRRRLRASSPFWLRHMTLFGPLILSLVFIVRRYILDTLTIGAAVGLVGGPLITYGAMRLFDWFLERPSKPRLARAPVSRLDRIARLFWSSKTYERVFAPLLADIHQEWIDAEARGDRNAARRIRFVRGPWFYLMHMGAQLPLSLLKKAAEIFVLGK